MNIISFKHIIYLLTLVSLNCWGQTDTSLISDPNYKFEKVIKFGDKYLIQTERWHSKEHRYIKSFYEYLGNKVVPFEIKEGYEIVSIEENELEYYCLLRNETTIELFKTSKNKIQWASVYQINNTENDYGLIIDGCKVVILSKDKIYHNLRNSKNIEVYDLTKLTCKVKSIFSHHSTLCFSGGTIYIGNDYGEWGGNLLKLDFNLEKNNLVCTEIAHVSNVVKLLPFRKNGILILSLLQHLGGLSNTIYQYNNDSLLVIFSQEGYNLKSKTEKDIYNWSSVINNKPILNFCSYTNGIFLIVDSQGIYKWNRNNGLTVLKKMNFEKEYQFGKEEPYTVIDNANDLQIIDTTLFVLHRLPIISKIKIE